MKVVRKLAFESADRNKREKAIRKLEKERDIVGLIRLLDSKYKDAVERAEIALAGCQFK